MKNKHTFGLLISLLSVLVACQSRPRFINHSQPNIAVAFDVTGCLKDGSGQCISDSTRAALGCDEIQQPPSLMRGLNPPYPIAVCQLIPDQAKPETQAEIEKGLYFFHTGG